MNFEFTGKVLRRLLWGSNRSQAQRNADRKAKQDRWCLGRIDKPTQILMALRYREMLHSGQPLMPISSAEFSNFSQNGEDGVLLYLFSLLGTTNKRAIEICAGDFVENNTTNLIVHHGWDGLLFDGDPANLRIGQAFYDSRRDDLHYYKPKMVQTWITKDNVNSLIREQGFAGEIDLFSLDIDGNDYWIWQALDCISPRVIVLEYQTCAGRVQAKSQPYDAGFASDRVSEVGASLPAFVHLGRRKGYRLIGTLGRGINAFFLRDDVGQDLFPEIAVKDLPSSGFFELPCPGWVDVA